MRSAMRVCAGRRPAASKKTMTAGQGPLPSGTTTSVVQGPSGVSSWILLVVMVTVHPRGWFCEPIRSTEGDTTIGKLEGRLANLPSYGQAAVMARETAKRMEKGSEDRQRRSEALASDLREVAGALVRRLR